MKILKIKLKQHTPLIHFQSGQYGATLRASEVKPKLDKFIVERLIDGGHDDLLGRWRMGETDALNYKLKIQTDEHDKINVKIPVKHIDGKFNAQFPMLLANMDDKEKRDDLMNMSCYKYVSLVFIAEDDTLLNLINVYLDCFLAITNFGNRQSKGFGSFFRANKTKNDFENELLRYYDKVYHKNYPDFNFEDYDSVKKTFKSLDTVYKKIKSGVFQTESKLHKYGKSRGIEWEKVAIAKTLKGEEIPKNVFYLRAVLGTTNSMSLKNVNKVIKIKSQLDDKGEEIVQRFRSPITFKFFDRSVYALPEDGVDNIIGKKFRFTVFEENADIEYGHIDLSVPKVNFMDFFDKAFDSLGWKCKCFE